MGFSQNTALPAVAAASTRSAWRRAGAAISTASTAGSASSSAGSVVAFGAPSELASLLAAPGGRVGHAGQPRPGQSAGEGLGVEGADGAGPDEPDRHRRGGGIADGHGGSPLDSEALDLVKAARNRARACSLSPDAHASSPTVPR